MESVQVMANTLDNADQSGGGNLRIGWHGISRSYKRRRYFTVGD
jgi:hypothetical protein